MKRVAYDATVGRLPICPPGSRISMITFDTCPGTEFQIRLHGVVDSNGVDECGMSENSWWLLECTDLPKRAIRLYRGSHSMSQLLRRYGFQVPGGCVNHKHTRLSYAPSQECGERTPPAWIPSCVVNSPGIPQFYPTSGVCWYAAMCGTSFMSQDILSVIEHHVADEDLRNSFRNCNFDRRVAEHLRKRLWYEYAVGDNVENPPEMDGRNGFAEFSVMCARFGVPIRRYQERKGHLTLMDERVVDQHNKTRRLRRPRENETHILALRFQDGDHSQRFPVQRRVRIGTQQYRLCGFYAGQKKCGHQIGVTSPTGSWRDWVILDADLHKDGISPIFVRFEGPEWLDDGDYRGSGDTLTCKWWTAWRELMHLTKFGMGGSEFCNLSPWNLNNENEDKFRGNTNNGTNSIDLTYISTTSESVFMGARPRRTYSKRSRGNHR